MVDDIRADPVELTRLAGDVLRASQRLADAWRSAQDGLAVPLSAFGNSDGAAGVRDSHAAVISDAEITIGRQVAVLEGDMDRLYRVAFAYRRHEQDEQANLRRAAAGLHPDGIAP
jgi:hypothetical protein